jgi:hypothetical protein
LVENTASLSLLAVFVSLLGLGGLSQKWQRDSITASETSAQTCHALYMSGVANAALGSFDAAIENCRQARDVADSIGSAVSGEISLMIELFCEVTRGGFDRARLLSNEVRSSALARGAGFYDGTAQCVEAFIEAWEGQPSGALAICAAGEATIGQDLDAVSPLLLAGTRALAHLRLGASETAQSYAATGIAIARTMRPTHMGMFLGHLAMAYVSISLVSPTSSRESKRQAGEALRQLERFSYGFRFARPFTKSLRIWLSARKMLSGPAPAWQPPPKEQVGALAYPPNFTTAKHIT